MIAAADRAPVAQFLSRLSRLDPGVLVRLRPEPGGAGIVWAMLPFRVLVGRRLTVAPPSDVTVGAAELAQWLRGADGAMPPRRDEAWRWPLPSSDGLVVETIPVAEVMRLAEAAARTVRDAIADGVGGRAVGERVLRDALLDHVAIVVTTDDGARVDIPQRMVQGLVRTGLLGEQPEVTGDTMGADSVTVRRAMGWIGMSSRYGSAWYRPISPLRLS
jgi:hypothetical protein